jgi:rhamnosyltransferase
MNSYNGEKFIKEQIDSIIAQQDVDVYFAIRDDGSKDRTIDILKNYSSDYPGRFQIILGEKNLGPSRSSYELLHRANIEDFELFAFADQDDYWLPQKMKIAILKLSDYPNDKPAFYFSNLTVTDAVLKPKFNVYDGKKIKPTKNSCFVEFCSSGNTFVFNKQALILYRDSKPLDYFSGDVWFSILCIFLGNVYYDDNSYILFRRTGENVSGDRKRGISLWIKRFKNLYPTIKSKMMMRHDMAQIIKRDYLSLLSNSDVELIDLIINYTYSFSNKIRLIFSSKVRSASFGRNICFWCRVLINRF